MPYGDYNRQREPYPAIPFIFLQSRDLIFTWSTNTNLVWNVAAVKTSDFDYVINESKIFILTTGFYEIIYELSVLVDSGAMTYAAFSLYKNGSQMKGSESFTTFPDAYPSCVSAHYYAALNRGDYIELHTVVGAGGGTLGAMGNSVRLIIKGMPMEGWNNGRGG